MRHSTGLSLACQVVVLASLVWLTSCSITHIQGNDVVVTIRPEQTMPTEPSHATIPVEEAQPRVAISAPAPPSGPGMWGVILSWVSWAVVFVLIFIPKFLSWFFG